MSYEFPFERRPFPKRILLIFSLQITAFTENNKKRASNKVLNFEAPATPISVWQQLVDFVLKKISARASNTIVGISEMAEKSCIKRLQKEYRALCKEPVSHVVARPSPNDILEWHYVLEGSEGTPFAGGYYYGKIKFPPQYPYKPPGISMTTPNGRFMTQKKICLSMSDFHPESWNPMWSVSSILTGLLSFMMDNSPTTGSVNTTVAEKQSLAKASLAFNCKNPTFRKLFSEYVDKYNQQQLSEKLAAEQVPAGLSQEISTPMKRVGEDMKRVDAVKDMRIDRKQSFPTWLMFLLVSIFGIVMALPLLQL
ncbi:ubiquitin-conjugating enzyme E2 34-like isoform X2 [Juglans microcarpa x Juglans regia]|uniref:ubiquitin-conjugating enzyme E2 34-like isoform X2 n=1 Tax=Juglans microcarpa x Juglans regia TaxID=2249226 RepID=UPI001B7F1238|nr:ubiquitin-conjugating enzyme E2 34-like isoform X2 [Juglans microcarpa x Juglans regia]